MLWLALAFVAILAIALIERYRPGTLIGGRAIKRPTQAQGGYTLEVRGTSKHQAPLRAKLKRSGQASIYIAQLREVDSDPTQVQVLIDNQLIGYLYGSASRQWQAMPRRPSSCAATLQEIEGSVQVWLRL